ncbi:unnamed protein product [Euphydryas editha]|uniref:Reverse transcriptase n=1 Tax=Euphydryas editha TaxID=104508 RepID=A0AAU9USK9_EUPED|nr:unnamed protein product [Euphydryas editha]
MQSATVIPIQRGVGYGLRRRYLSKLFTAKLEAVFKLLKRKGFVNYITGENITHFRFSIDIVLMEDLSIMLDDLDVVSQRLGLKIKVDKTKIMFNGHVVPAPVLVGYSIFEVVDKYIYLEQNVQLG